MKRILLMLALLIPAAVAAQVRLTFTDLVGDIERRENVRVFYPRDPLHGLPVSNIYREGQPLEAINQALRESGFRAWQYGSYVFVVPSDYRFTTTLAVNFDNDPVTADTVRWMMEGSDGTVKATSDAKLYYVGTARHVAGRVNMRGYVSDFKTGGPLAGITLRAREAGIAAVTDRAGNYLLTLEPGRYIVELSGVGIQNTLRQVLVRSDGRLDIELEAVPYEIEDITVSAQRLENVRSVLLGMERINASDVRNIPTAFGEADLMRILLSLPGVKSASEGSAGLNVRGGAEDQNLILFNGGTIYNPTHLFGMFSAFNPDVVRDMELYKSTIPAKYGGRLSSVLDINGLQGNMQKYSGSASVGVLTSRIFLEGPIVKEKTSIVIGARTTYSDWLLRRLPEKSGYRDGNAGFMDANLTLTHRFSDRDNFTVSGYYSNDRFKFEAAERYRYQNLNLSAKWSRSFSPHLYGAFSAGYDRYLNATNSNDDLYGYRYEFGIDQFFGKADLTWTSVTGHTLNFGADIIRHKIQPGEVSPRGEHSVRSADRLEGEEAIDASLYVNEQWDITRSFTVSAGLRWDIYGALGPRTYNVYSGGGLPALNLASGTASEPGGLMKVYTGPEFRFSARWEFADDFSVKAGFNSMRQNIHKLSNSTVISPTDTWRLSDRYIKPQRGWQTAVGIYRNILEYGLEFSVEGYYKKMNDYLDYRAGAELIMNHHIETDVVPVQGRAYGIEFMVRRMQGNLTGWISYSYSRTQLRQSDPAILNPVNNGRWYPADYDKPHELKIVANYKITRRFSFSANLDYSTGRPVTLPVSKYIYQDTEYLYFSNRNMYRVPDFFRIDASFNIEPRHRKTQRTHSHFTFGVYNLTGRKNTFSVFYKYEEGVLKSYRLAIFGVPIPFASYNIKF